MSRKIFRRSREKHGMRKSKSTRLPSLILVLGLLTFSVTPVLEPPMAVAKTQNVSKPPGTTGTGEGKPEDWGSPQASSSPSFSARLPVIWQVLIDSTFSYMRWWL